jgi:hypothetical protein
MRINSASSIMEKSNFLWKIIALLTERFETINGNQVKCKANIIITNYTSFPSTIQFFQNKIFLVLSTSPNKQFLLC